MNTFFYVYHAHQPMVFDVPTKTWVGNLRSIWSPNYEDFRILASKIYAGYTNLAQTILDLGNTSRYRAMVSFSGTLLEQVKEMEEHKFFRAAHLPSFFELYRKVLHENSDALELLVMPWSFPYLKTIPTHDYYRQIARSIETLRRCFGDEITGHLRGLYVPEFGLPQDTELFALIQAMRDCNLEWVLVDEDNLQSQDGEHVQRGQPRTLLAQLPSGEVNWTIALPCITRLSQDSIGGATAAHDLLLRETRRSLVPIAIGGVADLAGNDHMANAHWQEIKDFFASRRLDKSVASNTGSKILTEHVSAAARQWHIASDRFKTFPLATSAGPTPAFKMNASWWTDGFNHARLTAQTFDMSKRYNEMRNQFHERYSRSADATPPASIVQALDEAEQSLFILQDSSYRFWGDFSSFIYSALEEGGDFANHTLRLAASALNGRHDSE